jgi:hypothetical protein
MEVPPPPDSDPEGVPPDDAHYRYGEGGLPPDGPPADALSEIERMTLWTGVGESLPFPESPEEVAAYCQSEVDRELPLILNRAMGGDLDIDTADLADIATAEMALAVGRGDTDTADDYFRSLRHLDIGTGHWAMACAVRSHDGNKEATDQLHMTIQVAQVEADRLVKDMPPDDRQWPVSVAVTRVLKHYLHMGRPTAEITQHLLTPAQVWRAEFVAINNIVDEMPTPEWQRRRDAKIAEIIVPGAYPDTFVRGRLPGLLACTENKELRRQVMQRFFALPVPEEEFSVRQFIQESDHFIAIAMSDAATALEIQSFSRRLDEMRKNPAKLAGYITSDNYATIAAQMLRIHAASFYDSGQAPRQYLGALDKLVSTFMARVPQIDEESAESDIMILSDAHKEVISNAAKHAASKKHFAFARTLLSAGSPQAGTYDACLSYADKLEDVYVLTSGDDISYFHDMRLPLTYAVARLQADPIESMDNFAHQLPDHILQANQRLDGQTAKLARIFLIQACNFITERDPGRGAETIAGVLSLLRSDGDPYTNHYEISNLLIQLGDPSEPQRALEDLQRETHLPPLDRIYQLQLIVQALAEGGRVRDL